MPEELVAREDRYATDADVDAAIRSLSPANSQRLEAFAALRARGLQAIGVRDIEGMDLIDEALCRTVAGTRRWKLSVTFVKHMIETIRSIASHVGREAGGHGRVGIEGGLGDGEVDGSSGDGLLRTLQANAPSPEQTAAARDELARVVDYFKNDSAMKDLIDGLADGMTGPEIRTILGLSEQEFETRMTRLRRTVRKEFRS